jgi:ubiquitin C-terminal hydrolase
MAKFISDYEQINEPLLSLRNIKDAIDKYMPQFQGYNQHDAQEFIAMLIDKLTAELTIKVSTKFSKTYPSNDTKTSSNKTTETDEGTLNVSVMGNLFSGELCSTVICPYCNYSSKKKEPFYYLSIPLPQHVICVKSIEYVFRVYLYKKRREKNK